MVGRRPAGAGRGERRRGGGMAWNARGAGMGEGAMAGVGQARARKVVHSGMQAD